MPELPDIALYCESLESHFGGQTLERIRLTSPFLLRSVDPPLSAFVGKTLVGAESIGKRIVWCFSDDLFLVLHLMIAGRLRKKKKGTDPGRRMGLAAFDFPDASIVLTEASKKKRASLHAVRGRDALAEHDPGGIDVMTCSLEEFRAELVRENHTLKRTLTDPRMFSGIGNAYSDEILHDAQLSPVKWTTRLTDEESERLLESTTRVLSEWRTRLRDELEGEFPDKVTAFRPEMAAHGKYGEPCPRCGEAIQRIKRASNEVNYCAKCQTGGKLLADRGLSRLLKGDWPKSAEELEVMKRERKT